MNNEDCKDQTSEHLALKPCEEPIQPKRLSSLVKGHECFISLTLIEKAKGL